MRLARVAGLALGLLAGAAYGVPTPEEARAAAIRNLVLRNVHHDVQCHCNLYTEKSLDALRKETTPADVPALMLLLRDPASSGPVVRAARDLLVAYADESVPVLKECFMSRDEAASAAALEVLFQVEGKRGGDPVRTTRELADARARAIEQALPRANAAVLELVHESVAASAPECRMRADSAEPRQDWSCGVGDLRAGVAEFGAADAASRYVARTKRAAGMVSPFAGVGEESAVSDWKAPKAGAWIGGALVAFRRGTLVVTLEARAIGDGLASGETDRAQARARSVAKAVDAALARGPAGFER